MIVKRPGGKRCGAFDQVSPSVADGERCCACDALGMTDGILDRMIPSSFGRQARPLVGIRPRKHENTKFSRACSIQRTRRDHCDAGSGPRRSPAIHRLPLRPVPRPSALGASAAPDGASTVQAGTSVFRARRNGLVPRVDGWPVGGADCGHRRPVAQRNASRQSRRLRALQPRTKRRPGRSSPPPRPEPEAGVARGFADH